MRGRGSCPLGVRRELLHAELPLVMLDQREGHPTAGRCTYHPEVIQTSAPLCENPHSR